jgi:hypothetical protein
MLTDTSFHRRSYTKRLVKSHEAVPHGEQSDRMAMVLHAFAEGAGGSGGLTASSGSAWTSQPCLDANPITAELTFGPN